MLQLAQQNPFLLGCQRLIWATCFLLAVAESAHAQRQPYRVCLMSDLNSSYGSTDYRDTVYASLALLENQGCQLVLGAGDLVAGQSLDLGQSQLERMWQSFEENILRFFSTRGVPFLSTMGNHDASSARRADGSFIFDLERRVARSFWQNAWQQIPGSNLEWIDSEHFPFWYSLRAGPIWVGVVDGSSAGEVAREWEWLEQQLASDSAQTASFRVVVSHLPLFAVGQGKDRVGEILNPSEELHNLLRDAGVDVFVSGHHHAFYPGKLAGSPPPSPLLLALGALGNGPRRLLGSSAPPRLTLSWLDFATSESGRRQVMLTTVDPENGTPISHTELPASIPSLDGAGRAVTLLRSDSHFTRM